MLRLIKIEFPKAIYYRTFWIMLGLYLLLFIPTAYGLESIVKNIEVNGSTMSVPGLSIFGYPNVWFNMTYLAGWFKLILAVLVIIMVSNEYTFRTLRQNVIDGMSKWEVIWAKEIFIVILSLVAVVFLACVTLALGNSENSPGITTGSYVLIAYFISLILYLNFAYVLATYIKRSGFTIGLLLLYSLIIENIIAWRLPDNLSNLLPMETINRLIPNPFDQLSGSEVSADLSAMNIGLSIFYIVLFIVLIRFRHRTIDK